MIIEPKTKHQKFRIWLLVFAVINVLWMISFGIIHTDALGQNRGDYNWGIPLLNEITGTYTAFLLLPGLFFVWTRFPLNGANWFKRLPLYVGITLLTGALHTTLMLVSREILYPVFGFGEHDPGLLKYRYMMEFQKQVFWIWGTFGLLALVGHLRRYHENQLRSVKLQEQLVQSHLDVMRQQINPHFLFNTLNLISNKVYESAEEADRLITELADLLRVSLEMGRVPTVSLGRELKFLDKYLHIMKERFGDRFNFVEDIDPTCMNAQVPSLILQPIVENSFKHRLEADSAELTIDLVVKRSGEKMTIQIMDESSSDLKPSLKAQHGVGLKNIRGRLETMYKDEASFAFGAVDHKQFQVTMELPYLTQAVD